MTPVRGDTSYVSPSLQILSEGMPRHEYTGSQYLVSRSGSGATSTRHGGFSSHVGGTGETGSTAVMEPFSPYSSSNRLAQSRDALRAVCFDVILPAMQGRQCPHLSVAGDASCYS